jgi:hypothetical protein
MQELDRGVAIDPTEGDAVYREVFAGNVLVAEPIGQEVLDELMSVVAPGTPRLT